MSHPIRQSKRCPRRLIPAVMEQQVVRMAIRPVAKSRVSGSRRESAFDEDPDSACRTHALDAEHCGRSRRHSQRASTW